MARTVRIARQFLTPGWIAMHLLVLGAAVAMVLLGRWQLHVSDAKHFDLQNFSYVIQWWLFAACALFFWGRLIRDTIRKAPPPTHATTGAVVLQRPAGLARPGVGGPYQGPAELIATDADGNPIVYRGYVIPDSRTVPVRSHGDEYHDAYNDYLWQLALVDGEPTAGPAGAAEAEGTAAEDAGGEPPRALPGDATR